MTFLLTNDVLNIITKKSFISKGDSYYKLEDFMVVQCTNFVTLLKSFSGNQ